MKKWLLAAIVLGLASDLRAQQAGQFGAGLILGDPIGGTVKYWVSGTQAFDAGVGFGGGTVFYADYLWHAWDILPKPKQGKLGLYVGAGGRLETDTDAAFGIRMLGGMDYWFEGRPIELFLEAGPVFRLARDQDVTADAGLGIRFYFGRSK